MSKRGEQLNNTKTQNRCCFDSKGIFKSSSKTLLSILVGLPTYHVNADQNKSLTLFLGQSSNDYFEEFPSSLDTDSKGFVYAYSLNERLTISVSTQEANGGERWLVIDRDNFIAYNQAETESRSYMLSSSWYEEDYSFHSSYSKSEASERSLSWMPRVIERLESETNVFDFSISHSIVLSSYSDANQLSFDWTFGIQYADFDAEIIDVIGTDSLLIVGSDIQLKQYSSFVDVGLSWWLEPSNFAWSPFVHLTWNFELDTNGQQTALLSRGGDERSVNLLDGRFTDEVNIPDSGEWQVGLALLLDNGWSFDLSYSHTVSTEYPSDHISTSISVFF